MKRHFRVGCGSASRQAHPHHHRAPPRLHGGSSRRSARAITTQIITLTRRSSKWRCRRASESPPETITGCCPLPLRLRLLLLLRRLVGRRCALQRSSYQQQCSNKRSPRAEGTSPHDLRRQPRAPADASLPPPSSRRTKRRKATTRVAATTRQSLSQRNQSFWLRNQRTVSRTGGVCAAAHDVSPESPSTYRAQSVHQPSTRTLGAATARAMGTGALIRSLLLWRLSPRTPQPPLLRMAVPSQSKLRRRRQSPDARPERTRRLRPRTHPNPARPRQSTSTCRSSVSSIQRTSSATRPASARSSLATTATSSRAPWTGL